MEYSYSVLSTRSTHLMVIEIFTPRWIFDIVMYITSSQNKLRNTEMLARLTAS